MRVVVKPSLSFRPTVQASGSSQQAYSLGLQVWPFYFAPLYPDEGSALTRSSLSSSIDFEPYVVPHRSFLVDFNQFRMETCHAGRRIVLIRAKLDHRSESISQSLAGFGRNSTNAHGSARPKRNVCHAKARGSFARQRCRDVHA